MKSTRCNRTNTQADDATVRILLKIKSKIITISNINTKRAKVFDTGEKYENF